MLKCVCTLWHKISFYDEVLNASAFHTFPENQAKTFQLVKFFKTHCPPPHTHTHTHTHTRHDFLVVFLMKIPPILHTHPTRHSTIGVYKEPYVCNVWMLFRQIFHTLFTLFPTLLARSFVYFATTVKSTKRTLYKNCHMEKFFLVCHTSRREFTWSTYEEKYTFFFVFWP